jgi:acyl phosphate:glycerol-3-phosphate acyltransferase
MLAVPTSPPILYAAVVAALVASYLIGSIPTAYVVVRLVTGEDITQHGTGNVGSMNVRRTTGSWTWFAVAMLGDGLKGLIPVLIAKGLASGPSPAGVLAPVSVNAGLLGYGTPAGAWLLLLPQAALLGSVLGHNYSLWVALVKHRLARSGKGLATGAGALLVYDWRYFAVVLVVGLVVIALTRYFMAGQVAATISLPIAALALRSPDWPFALLMAAVVYAAHHSRFIGMLHGREPKLYLNEHSAPRT